MSVRVVFLPHCQDLPPDFFLFERVGVCWVNLAGHHGDCLCVEFLAFWVLQQPVFEGVERVKVVLILWSFFVHFGMTAFPDFQKKKYYLEARNNNCLTITIRLF